MKEYKSQLPEFTLKYKKGNIMNVQFRTSKDIFELSQKFLNLDTVELLEEFLVIYLNKQLRTLGWIRMSSGGIVGTVADPRLIFATAVLSGASAFICVHNHPSGAVHPSTQDDTLTKKLFDGGKILEIELIDHVIISGDLDGWYSYADEGRLNHLL